MVKANAFQTVSFRPRGQFVLLKYNSNELALKLTFENIFQRHIHIVKLEYMTR